MHDRDAVVANAAVVVEVMLVITFGIIKRRRRHDLRHNLASKNLRRVNLRHRGFGDPLLLRIHAKIADR